MTEKEKKTLQEIRDVLAKCLEEKDWSFVPAVIGGSDGLFDDYVLPNGEVGTVGERVVRFKQFCDNYEKCYNCPCYKNELFHCYNTWERLPYESEEKE